MKKITKRKNIKRPKKLSIMTSPLNNAIASGNVHSVKELLKQGVDPNEFTNVWCSSTMEPWIQYTGVLCKPGGKNNDIGTSIQLALYLRHTDIIHMLLGVGGVDIHKQYRKYDKTTLQLSVSCGLDIVKKVYEKGCTDVNHVDFEGHTALIDAVWHKYAPQVDSRLDIIRYLIDKKSNVNYKDDTKGWTALELACKLGHIDVIKYLLIKGAHINNINKRGRTPLHEAIISDQTNSNSNKDKVVALLLRKGAKVNTLSNDTNSSPLLSATYYGLVNIVKLLVGHGAHKKTKDIHKMTPLEVGRMNGFHSIVKLLA